MNKFLFIVTFSLYVLFIEYCSSMIVFDFKKYILKDKFLQDLKFSIKWKEIYAEKKTMARLKKEYNLEFLPNARTSVK